jgi:hypothetical protein
MSLCVLFFVASAATDANEIVDGRKEGSIVLRAAGHERAYENITGNEQYVNRSLSTINGSPAILVLGRDTQYFTLAVERDQIVIDCAYSDTRNNYNGARVTIATCGLNLQLDETYSDAVRKNSEHIQRMIYSFDTQFIVNNSGLRASCLEKSMISRYMTDTRQRPHLKTQCQRNTLKVLPGALT